MSEATPTLETVQDELIAIRRQLAAAEQRAQQAEQRVQLIETIVHDMPVGVSIWHQDDPDDPCSFRLISANPANQQFMGFDPVVERGNRFIDIFPGVPRERLVAFEQIIRDGQVRDLGERVARDQRIGGQVLKTIAIPLSDRNICFIGENVTERHRAEEMRRQVHEQEEMIRAQQAVLAELSTPLIPFSDQIVVMPLIGAIDSQRAQQVMETLLSGIASSRAAVAILDITGVAVVDTRVADALIRAAQAVKLLGAQLVLTGIRPEVAQTLVGLGADLTGIITRGSLQSGVAYAVRS